MPEYNQNMKRKNLDFFDKLKFYSKFHKEIVGKRGLLSKDALKTLSSNFGISELKCQSAIKRDYSQLLNWQPYVSLKKKKGTKQLGHFI